jgi:hypothetical protein
MKNLASFLASAGFGLLAGLFPWRASGAALASGVYQTQPGATVEERGDRVPNGRRVVPFSATVTLEFETTPPSLTALIANAVLEGGAPFALTVRSSTWYQLENGQYRFDGDYLRDLYPAGTQYLFAWELTPASEGGAIWNGLVGWAGGHAWYVTVSNLVLVPRAQLRLTRAGAGSVQMAWATNFADHVLEYATTLPAEGWSLVTNAVATTGGRCLVTVDTAAAPRFFRLRRP